MINQRQKPFIDYITAICLFIFFFSLYSNSIDIHSKNISSWNFIFDADNGGMIDIFTNPNNFGNICKHFLYAFFFKNLTLSLDALVKDAGRSTLFVTCFIGTMSIPLIFLLLLKIFKNRLESLLFTMLFGFSASMWLLSSIPETYSMNVAMIVLAFYLQTVITEDPKGSRLNKISFIYIIQSVIATGITVANGIYSFFSLLNFYRKYDISVRQKIKRLSIYIIISFILIIALSYVQKILYPKAYLHFLSYAFYKDVSADMNMFACNRQGLFDMGRIMALLKTFLLDNIIAPKVILKELSDYNIFWNILGFTVKNAYLYLFNTAIYSFFIASTIVTILNKKLFRDLDIQLVAIFMAFNFLLHFFYRGVGVPFIFSTHLVFSIIYLLARGYHMFKFKFKKIILIIFVISIICNNAIFINSVNYFLRNANPECTPLQI